MMQRPVDAVLAFLPPTLPNDPAGRVLFRLYPGTSAALTAHAEILDWLRAAGVDPDTIVANASLLVVDNEGALNLVVWQRIPDEQGDIQPCLTCQSCVAARAITVPLVAAIPGNVAAAGTGDADPGWLAAVNGRAAEQRAARDGGPDA